MSQDQQGAQMSADDLYREEIFTDRRVGTIRRLIPVAADGNDDGNRAIIYMGETQVMLGNQPLPINFEIDADNLGDAAKKFGEMAKQTAEDTVKRLQEMQREMQNKIVVPGQGGGMGGMGSPPPPGGIIL